MAFCAKGIGKARKFFTEIDEVLEPIIDNVTTVTKDIKELKTDPTVEQIDALIPDDSALQMYFDTGLNLLIGTANAVGTFSEKLSKWLSGKTELEVNSNLAKLASVTTSVAHDHKHSESFYDTAIQVHLEGLK